MLIPNIYVNISTARLAPNYTDKFSENVAIKVLSGSEDNFGNRTQIVKFNLTEFQKGFFEVQVDFLNPLGLSESLLT